MADYVREQVLAGLATNVATVTVANGYKTTISAVHRFATAPPAEVIDMLWAGDPIALIFDGAENLLGREVSETNHEQWDFRPVIRVILSDAVTPSTTMNGGVGDIKKLIAADRQWVADNIIDSYVTSIDELPEETKPYVGFDATVAIQYETTADSP